ncbi:MAG: hypothetical protein HC795_12975 [Coleofasciculaceae cyanobacterium RL_1_1]|nr:hypothetical protein [Coleofasciculaceae cyanobacterium RL_1_1]
MQVHTAASLNQLTLKGENGLRSIAKSMSLKGYCSLKKAALIDAILEAQGKMIQPAAATDEPTAAIEVISIESAADLTESESLIESTAAKIYRSLSDYVFAAAAAADPFAGMDDFFAAVSSASAKILNLAHDASRSGEIVASTAAAYFSQVMKALESRVTAAPPVSVAGEDDFLKVSFDRLYRAVNGSLSEIKKAKRDSTRAGLNARQNSAINIQARNLIVWAAEYLKVLPESPARWREVAVAIAVLSGRRQSEIMSSGIFTPITPDLISFDGQLKRHDDIEVGSIEIPILMSAAHDVARAIEWLSLNGKRTDPADRSREAIQAAAKKSHTRCSRYLSEVAKAAALKIEIEGDEDQWQYAIHDANGEPTDRLKDRRNFHMYRQIYAQLAPAYLALKPENRHIKFQQLRAKIMGHSMSATSQNSAQESYDSDVIVSDIEAILAMM